MITLPSAITGSPSICKSATLPIVASFWSGCGEPLVDALRQREHEEEEDQRRAGDPQQVPAPQRQHQAAATSGIVAVSTNCSFHS